MATDKKVILIDLTIETSKVVKAITDATAKVKALKNELESLQKAFADAGVKGTNSFKEAEKAVAGKQKELSKVQTELEKYKTKLAEITASAKKNQAEELALAKEQQKQKDAIAKQIAKEAADRDKAAKAAEAAAQKQKERDAQAEQDAKKLSEAIQSVGDTIEQTFGGKGVPDVLLQNIASVKEEIQRVNEVNAILRQGLAETEVGSEKYKELQTALAGNEVQMRGLRSELTGLQKEADNIVKANTAQEGSYEQLYRQYVDAEKQLKLLEGTTKRNADGTIVVTAEYKKAAKEVRQLKEGLLEFNKGILDGRLNVGNYASSITDALNATGLFGTAITQVKGAIEGTQTAIGLIKDGAKLVSDGFTAAGSAFSTFGDSFNSFVTQADESSETFTSSVDAIGGIGDTANETKEQLDATGDAAVKSGKAFLTGGNIGANGMKILKFAIASTGIGLLVIAVGGLIAYFTKFQKGIDLVKQAFAGLTAVFDVVIGALGTIGEALATFDFSKAADSLSGLGGAAANAAKEAANLEKAKQKLADKETAELKRQFELRDAIGDLKLITDDKTKSDQERVDAFKKAGEAEQALIKIQLDNEKERLRILDAELNQRIKNRTATREELREREELYVKTLELEDDYNDKLRETAVEASKLQKRINEEKLQAQRALAANEIKLAEINGKSTFELRKKLAKDELDAFIADKQKSDADKAVAQSNYEVEIASIEAEAREERKKKRKEAAEKDLELERAIQDANIQLITDGKTRELAAEAVALERSLAEIKGKTEKEQQLRTLLIAQSAQKIQEIEAQYAEQRLEKINEDNERNTDALIASTERLYEDKQSVIDAALADEQITQEQAAAQTIALELQKQQEILEIQKRALLDRQVNEKAFYDEQEKLVQEQLASGKITLEQASADLKEITTKRNEAALLTEQELGQKVLDTQRTIDTQKIDLARATSAEIKANAELAVQQQVEQQNLSIAAIQSSLSALADLLSQSAAQRKGNANILRTLAKGEILVAAYQEISGYWQGAGQDAKRLGAIGAAVSTAIASAQSIAALARAYAGIAKVNATKFAEGGFTVQDAVTKYNPMFDARYAGGFVNNPTMWVGRDGGLKLAGEAGTEWVGANWQVKQAPEIFAALETWRRTGVRAFEDGGFTSMNIASPVIDTAKSIESAIAKGYANAPAPVVSVVEINEVQNRVQTIESRSTLG